MKTLFLRMLSRSAFLPVVAIFASLLFMPAASAQYDRDQDRNRDYDRVTRIEPGTVLAVRTTQWINVERQDNVVYHGTVDQEVRGENGRLAIPRGAPVDLRVRVAPDNDLVIDVDSVLVNGQRLTLDTTHDREQAQPAGGLVGSILNNVPGVQVRGHAVHVPRGYCSQLPA